MKRRLLNLLTAMSLLLCVAAVAMWVRSHVTADHINYFRWVGSGRDVVERHRMFSAASAEGALIVSTMQVLRLEGGFESGSQTGWRYGRAPSHPDHILRALSLPFFGGPASVDVRGAGFAFQYRRGRFTAMAPWWSLLALASALPALRAWRRRRSGRRASRGLCRACGYDLRASPGTCPECGAAPAPVPSRLR